MAVKRVIKGVHVVPMGTANAFLIESPSKFPKGTVFVIEAWAPLAEADGTEVKDPSVLDPKIIAFTTDGEILGAIKMGAGSPAAVGGPVRANFCESRV